MLKLRGERCANVRRCRRGAKEVQKMYRNAKRKRCKKGAGEERAVQNVREKVRKMQKMSSKSKNNCSRGAVKVHKRCKKCAQDVEKRCRHRGKVRGECK